MRGVEVESVRGHLGPAENVGGEAGEDGMSLFEEGVEGAAEAVVVEFAGGDVPEVFGPGPFGPGGHVAQRGGRGESGGQ